MVMVVSGGKKMPWVRGRSIHGGRHAVDFNRHDAGLNLAIDGACRAAQSDVNAGRNGRHQFAFGTLRRQAHHDRHWDGALLLVRLTLQEREQAQRKGERRAFNPRFQ